MEKKDLSFPSKMCLKCSPDLLPAIYKTWDYWNERNLMMLQRSRQEPFFAALLLFCTQSVDFRFYTKNYPVYRILCKYISVYSELGFIDIHYDGNNMYL